MIQTRGSYYRLCLFFLMLVTLAGGIVPVSAVAAGPLPDFAEWLAALRQEALAAGISRQTVAAALTDLKPIDEVVALDRNQPEFKLTLDDYLVRVVFAERIRKGRRLLHENHKLLQAVYQQYHVQPRFLVALWGIETDFGRVTGNFPVVEALATLAYDGRRSDFFRSECLAALRLVDDGLVSLSQMKGSWAGAMGEMQFLPSVFSRFAVDYDGNGRIDVWKERGDIFASAANYLQASGWQGDHGWGYEIVLPQDCKSDLVGESRVKIVSAWQGLGIRRQDGQPFPEASEPASIIQPDGPAGRAFLVFNNYQVLLTWNRSHYYAIGVGLLADQLRADR